MKFISDPKEITEMIHKEYPLADLSTGNHLPLCRICMEGGVHSPMRLVGSILDGEGKIKAFIAKCDNDHGSRITCVQFPSLHPLEVTNQDLLLNFLQLQQELAELANMVTNLQNEVKKTHEP